MNALSSDSLSVKRANSTLNIIQGINGNFDLNRVNDVATIARNAAPIAECDPRAVAEKILREVRIQINGRQKNFYPECLGKHMMQEEMEEKNIRKKWYMHHDGASFRKKIKKIEKLKQTRNMVKAKKKKTRDDIIVTLESRRQNANH